MTAAEKAAKMKKFAATAERNKGHKLARHKAVILLPAETGCVFVVSDAHYRPHTPVSAAHKAAVYLAKKLKPYAIVNNGDALDFSRISRWPVGSYKALKDEPMVIDDLAETSVRLEEFEDLKFIKWCTWNLGNHDARFETRLADVAGQYAGVYGFTLKEHFTGWIPAWATTIGRGKDSVVIKHRYKNGVYAAHNNALWSGRNYVTGHLHMLYAKAITDLNGTRWGIEAGTLADIKSETFSGYTEANPLNWQSGFAILHFEGGKFAGPELVHAMPDGRVLFRGRDISGVI